jgi:S-adenosylmethionine:diacylglycerol 3-amino-3-carboxypropyl transferase
MWLPDNYFYYAYIAGKWSKECCPRYLEEENFPKLKKYADRVQLFHGPVAAASQLRNDFTVASLLDSMDWMPDSMIAEQMQALIPQMQPGPKGHIFWRSFATKVHSPVLASLRPDLVPDEDGSERVGWYLTQWVAEVPRAVRLHHSLFL